MQIEQIPFGSFENQNIEQFILRNTNGMVVKIMNYGATITSITIPDSNGKVIELACGFDTFEEYFQEEYRANAPYFGCTVGRYASRIKDGKFSIDGQDYTLAVNDGSNHLHGGLTGFDKMVWTGEATQIDNNPAVKMTLRSAHLEEGYPGNVDLAVRFSLTDKNEIVINYEGSTDQTTPLSLTNHTYFNLSGFSETIESTEAIIHANAHLKPDQTNVPVGEIESIVNTVADLRAGKVLGECFKELETGFEHYYLLENSNQALKLAAEFKDPKSGRKLSIHTTEPGALFYTGYFTSNDLSRGDGTSFGRFKAFCFESSRYPNGPNIPNSPGSLTHPGENYNSTTVFAFS